MDIIKNILGNKVVYKIVLKSLKLRRYMMNYYLNHGGIVVSESPISDEDLNEMYEELLSEPIDLDGFIDDGFDLEVDLNE